MCGDGVDRCIMGLCVCVDLCVESVLEVKGEREAVGKPRKMRRITPSLKKVMVRNK